MSPFSPKKCISCRANRLHLSSQTPTFHLSNRSSRAAVDCMVADRGYTTGDFSGGANATFTASVTQSFGLYRHRCFYDIVGLMVNLSAFLMRRWRQWSNSPDADWNSGNDPSVVSSLAEHRLHTIFLIPFYLFNLSLVYPVAELIP